MKKAKLKDAYNLFHRGSLVLARMEANGIKIDTKYLDEAIASTTDKIRVLESDLRGDPVFKMWKKIYGTKTKLSAKEQLATVLYDHMGYKYEGELTASKKYKSDEVSLLKVNNPFIRKYITLNKLKDDKTKYLQGIKKEVDYRGYLHCVFNLAGGSGEDDGKGGTRTYRSSSSLINFQNFPVRDPIRGKLVRRAIIARKGHQIVEVDFSGIEVVIAYCYHKDRNMRKYLFDPKMDMHREMGAMCYCLDVNQVDKSKPNGKQIRYGGKNKFVFPQFYGSYYADCARDLWDWIDQAKLKIDGTNKGLKEHLASKGIRKLGKCEPDSSPVKGTFEYHIKEVQDHFWDVRFPEYRDWKKSWYKNYIKAGGIRMYSGFEVHGVYRRNEIINYPVQGAAFHCLLWCLVRLQEAMDQRGMKSLIIGQIHDSLVLDVVVEELDDILDLIQHIMSVELPEAWEWIIAPMRIEAEVAPVGGSWADKKEIDLSPNLGA